MRKEIIEKTNALSHETSPYLLQHATNPVNWYPWNEDILQRAKQENKPILLSIGYSACHWCHVMAHESFEDEETAALMNKLFINIKVDREERPDLDKIYQTAHQFIAQRAGGWPLTMFLHPDTHYPFFGGTYFPPEPRYGMPAFKEVLQRIADFYTNQTEQLQQHGQALSQAFQQYEQTTMASAADIEVKPLNLSRQQIIESFDNVKGGFGQAPKFPHIPNIQRLLHHYVLTQHQEVVDEEGVDVAFFTLEKMALGGIYDQLGGGFYRYSVDDLWMIPHFEKMLYDNASFLSIYSQAWQLATRLNRHEADLFKQVIIETANWVIKDMQSPEGGFYSTLDADSEGHEGKFYIWSREDVNNHLDETEYTVFSKHFGLEQAANFEGQWHLYVQEDIDNVAKRLKLTKDSAQQYLMSACQKLYQVRQQRIAPDRDEKILTAWNALMIKGLAQAGLALNHKKFIIAAEQALAFIKQTLWQDGKLLATYKDGQARLNAYLDDYAFLLDAVLTLLQVRWRSEDMEFAIELAEILLRDFFDHDNGGFYFTAQQHEKLITRPKSFNDDAIPSGNGIAASALGKLGYLLAEPRYLEVAEKTIKASWSQLKEHAYVNNTMLLAVEDYLFPPQIIILRGKSALLQQWQAVCQEKFAPQRLCFAITDEAIHLPTALVDKKVQGEIVAYICEGHQCSQPITDLSELKQFLDKIEF